MNERYENYNADEVEIDLIDFLFYLMRRWKSLVAMVLLGAVLGGAFYMVKSSKTTEETIEEEYQPEVSTEENMKLAAQYRRLYEQQMDYNQHSIVMQMNPNQVYEGTLTYYLAAGEQTELLSQLYMNLIDDQTVLAEVKAAAGLDCDDQYIRELLSSSVAQKDTGDDTDLSGNVVNNLQVVVPDSALSKTIITYQIAYLDKETCEKMTTAFKNAVEVVKQQYEDTYGVYDLDLVQNAVAVTVDQSYQDKQNTNATRVDNYLTKLVKLEDAFSDTEMAYYQEKYLAAEHVDVAQPQEVQSGISVKDLVKWLLIGMFGLAVLWGAYYFLKYLLDPSIKTLDEVKQMGLPVIGYLGKENENPTIIERLEKKKNGSYDTVDYVARMIEMFHEKEILLGIDCDVDVEKHLGEVLEQKTSKIKKVNLIQTDVRTLELAAKSTGIIFGIRFGKTVREQLLRALEICKMQKIKVLGIVIIEE